MIEPVPLSRRVTAAALAAVAWLALALQLSNLLVALGLTATIPAASPRGLRRLAAPPGAAALAGYITVVGAVYHLVLRQLWTPRGAQLVADVLPHTVMPLGYVLYWVAFVPKGRLGWSDVWPAPVSPGLYTLASLIRGALLHVYPYPFIDGAALGYPAVLRNVILLFAGFLVVSLAYIAIDRTMRAQPIPGPRRQT